MKNSQESTEPPGLHIIKHEEEIVDSSSVGIVREERICKIAGNVHFLFNIFNNVTFLYSKKL